MVAAMWPASDRPSPPPPAGRAVPSLGPFAELLGQPYQRLKVAVLRQLAGLPEPSWSLAEAGQALTWLEPATANRLLSELRGDGLVIEVDRYGQPDRAPAWRLSDEGHLVATVCAVLAAPAIAPERAVKVLAAALALARAAGVGEPATFAPFVAATAVLERDLAALHRLIDQGDDAALATAAEVADVHLADLAEMARQVARPGGHETERELAAAVAGRLRTLIDEILGGEARPAPATELRELVAATDPAALAGLVASRLQLPPAVAPVRATAALAALDAHLGLPEPVVVPLPEPALLPIESPEVVPDFVLLAGDVITWLAGLGETDLARWVVGGTWAEATARMAAVVEAWSRWGPAGDASLAAELDPRPRLEVVGRDEVGVISWTGVRAPQVELAAQRPVVIDLTDEQSGERQEVAT
ncbi:MAG TPA: hypothetical protein VFA73_05600 [Actinomycetota bacterium]|nr:hypothetical protein [Actinomycetota bacterium]